MKPRLLGLVSGGKQGLDWEFLDGETREDWSARGQHGPRMEPPTSRSKLWAHFMTGGRLLNPPDSHAQSANWRFTSRLNLLYLIVVRD